MEIQDNTLSPTSLWDPRGPHSQHIPVVEKESGLLPSVSWRTQRSRPWGDPADSGTFGTPAHQPGVAPLRMQCVSGVVLGGGPGLVPPGSQRVELSLPVYQCPPFRDVGVLAGGYRAASCQLTGLF